MNLNSTRPPPPRGAPPPYAFVGRVYGRSLRPIVITFGSLAAIWTLVWGISSLRDISIDKDHAARLEVFDIVLGTLYLVTCVIELWGIAGAIMRRMFMIRVYSILSLGAALFITAAEVMRVVIHFAFKSELINECIALSTGDTIVTRFGIWGPSSTTILNSDDASSFCNQAWSHDSFSEIAWLLVAGILSLLFASVAFAFYRQMLDPTSPVNARRAPSAQARGTYPTHYNPPYDTGSGAAAWGSVPELPYGGGQYAPPPGAPPSHYAPPYDASNLKPPGYAAAEDADSKGYGGYTAGEDDKKDDPFSDFDASSGRTRGDELEEHDVTSRPAPGAPERF